MKFTLKKGITYESFEDRGLMMERILMMISESKLDKIIYKGDKNDINYKTMKRILNDTNKKNSVDVIKNTYSNLITSYSQTWCLIYKEKN